MSDEELVRLLFELENYSLQKEELQRVLRKLVQMILEERRKIGETS